MLYLDELVEELFAGHVTVDSVVSVLEVRSEVVKQRVQVHQVVAALFTAVDALTTLTDTHAHIILAEYCRLNISNGEMHAKKP